VRALAASKKISAVLRRLGCAGARPVRAVFFDKNPAKNWAIPWHQDIAIAVAARIDTPGFSGWSAKEGVPHVNPPPSLLARMATLRIHLDDCDAANGALRVAPGSHRHGLLNDADVARLTAQGVVTCHARRSDVVAMRPLMLHASSRATSPSHRRVIHLEYSADQLPNGLAWFEDTAAPEVCP
jgi:ectoine hydroxylase-related dioxygenase (phytanoyl-CoA dioxygenase family)